MKKRLLSLFMAIVLCFSSTVITQGVVAEAAMADEAEDYELGETYNGRDSGERYFKFEITEKSHVVLYVEFKWGTSSVYSDYIYFDIYNSDGEQVLRDADIICKENKATGIYTGSQSRTLAEGIYYIKINRRLAAEFSFTIQAEPQIKLPKGTFESLKSSKKGQMTVVCEESEDAIGYRIQYSTDYKFKTGVKTIETPEPKKTITDLKKGKRYYVKVCPYSVYDDGTMVYGQNSKVKAVKIKSK